MLKTTGTAARERLGKSLLKLYDALRGVGARQHQLPCITLSMIELQLDAALLEGEPSAAASTLHAVVEQLTMLQSTIQHGQYGSDKRDLKADVRLLLRVRWARARCEEALGEADGSIAHLAECRSLLTYGAPEMTVRPLPLLHAPQSIELKTVEGAATRQTQQRLVQSAQGLLGRLHVHSWPCVRGEWACEVLHNKGLTARRGQLVADDQPAGEEALARCGEAWSSVISSASAAASAALKQSAIVVHAAATSSRRAPRPHLSSSLLMLHVCWSGICLRGVEGAATTLATHRAVWFTLLNCFHDVLLIAARARKAAAAQAAEAAAAAAAAPPPPPPQPQPADAALTSPMATVMAAPEKPAKQGESAVKLSDRQAERWLLQLLTAIDSFQQAIARRSVGSSSAAAQPSASSCSVAAERLLEPLTTLAQQAETKDDGTSLSPVVLHYSLTAFCKLWLLRPGGEPPRASREVLALFDGAWRTLTNPSHAATPLYIPAEGRSVYPPGRAGKKAAGKEQRLQNESPFVQLCMVTALAQLRDASSKCLDEPQIDLYGEGGEGEEETANSQDEECEEAAGSQDGDGGNGGGGPSTSEAEPPVLFDVDEKEKPPLRKSPRSSRSLNESPRSFMRPSRRAVRMVNRSRRSLLRVRTAGSSASSQEHDRRRRKAGIFTSLRLRGRRSTRSGK